jgi:YegS/Rv2252/BmrU family lipid kinase
VRAALDAAEREGATLVLASGGDGTIGSVARCLVDSRLALTVIPAGTSNDFARSLRLPLGPESAVRVARLGRVVRVDMGEVNGEGFAHAAVAGLNAEFAKNANRLRPVLHRLAYPAAAVQTFLQRRSREFVLEFDGQTRTIRALELAFVNAPAVGGALGLEVEPASLVDRKLTVVAIQDMTVREAFDVAVRSLRRHEIVTSAVEEFSVQEVRMTAPNGLQVTLDGETGPCIPVTVRVLPGSLRVVVPNDFPLASSADGA